MIDPGADIGHVHLKVADLERADGNGVELSWDRPREEWPRGADGSLLLVNEPLELESILAARAEA